MPPCSQVHPVAGGGERSEVQARGELQLGILIENMRREGMELAVSPPQARAAVFLLVLLKFLSAFALSSMAEWCYRCSLLQAHVPFEVLISWLYVCWFVMWL